MDLYKIRNELGLGTPLNSLPLRVTFYSRVSTDHLEQKGSLKNQIEFMEEMIKNNANWVYIDGYIDEGISGTTDYKRLSFLKMIDDAKMDKFDLIITKEISRFSRNTLDSIKYSRELLSYGVAVYFLNDNINTLFPDSELRLTIMSSLAQDEVRRLSERVKFGMLRSIKNGVILGNDLQYGYKKDKLTGKLNIIDKEAAVVRRLFSYYAIDKMSLRSIAKIFNEENIMTSLNKKWNITTLKRMIENPKYKGDYCGRKTEIVDYMSKKKRLVPKSEWIYYEDSASIPAIIDIDLWNLANKRLYERKKRNNRYQNRYLLSAKMYCMKDNCLYHRKGTLKANQDVVWICSNVLSNGKEYCNSISIRESEIIYILKDGMNNLGISLERVEDILAGIYLKYKLNIDEILEEIFNREDIYRKLMELLLKKIEINNSEEIIKLSITFNTNESKSFQKNYEFKRGFNTTGTKRYIVHYYVTFLY